MLLSFLRGPKSERNKLSGFANDCRGVTAVEVALLMLLLVPMLVVVVDLFQLEGEKRRLHQLSRAMASNIVANFDSPTFELGQQELVYNYFKDRSSSPETRIVVEACFCDQQEQGPGGFCDADQVPTQIISVRNRGRVIGTWLSDREIDVGLKVKRVGSRGC